MRFKLSQKGKKTNILKEKPKVTYSVALVLAFLSAENENQQLEDLSLAHFLLVDMEFSSRVQLDISLVRCAHS